MRRGSEFSIIAGAGTLMNSRLSGSEVALADLASDHLRGRGNCHILIGGYGMGFTLRAVLAGAGSDVRITVAELVPEVLEWARGPMAELTAGCLDDPRVNVLVADVGSVIARQGAHFDAILLDVDNGPDGFSRSSNDRLYSLPGLVAAFRALQPKGMLGIWSAAPDAKFASRLKTAGFVVKEIKARANNGRGGRHVIWTATKEAHAS